MVGSLTKNTQGLSLLEAVLYVALVVLLLGSLGILIQITNNARARESVRREVEDQGRQVMEIIAQTVRNASAINAPSAGATGSTLSVNVDASSSSPTVFVLAGSTITMREGSGAVTGLTNSKISASAFSVQNLSRASTPGTVRVSFALSSLVSSGSKPFIYSQTFYVSASLR